jgi:hypothetical protein
MLNSTLSIPELQARLQQIAGDLVLHRAAGDYMSSSSALMEAMAATVEALAEAQGQAFDRSRAQSHRDNHTDPVYQAVREAETSEAITLALMTATGDARRFELVSTWADDELVTPEHFQMLDAGIPSWGFYTPERKFSRQTRAYLDLQVNQILDDVTHPRLPEMLLAVGRVANFSGTERDGPFAPRIVAYAEGRVPGAAPTHQRLAAMSLLGAPWVGPQALSAVVRAASGLEIEQVRIAITRPHANADVWQAAVQSPLFPHLVDDLSKIPDACRDPMVWSALFDVVQGDRGRNGTDQMARLLRTAPAESLDRAIRAMIVRKPARAFELLGRLARSRLHAISPETLVPLMASSDRKIREGMVVLMEAVGPDAAPVRPRPRR